jgi:hypothetical protein
VDSIETPGDPLHTYGSGDVSSKARRNGPIVVRDSGPWSPTVLALLRHLEQNGFTGAPRVVGSGFDDSGREVLTFLPGDSPHPRAWTDDAAHRVGVVLRRAHDAARGFLAPFEPRWQPWFGRELPGENPVIGHCDVGPWNWVAGSDGLPYGLIDWEFAGPTDALWELAAATWLNAQLHDDDIAERQALPDLSARARQARLVLDGYGLSRTDRAGMVERMIEFAVHAARAEATTYRVCAVNPSGDDAGGYPVLWAVTWRTRSASFMLGHRRLLETIVES